MAKSSSRRLTTITCSPCECPRSGAPSRAAEAGTPFPKSRPANSGFVSLMASLKNVNRLLHAQCPLHVRMEGAGIGEFAGSHWLVLPGPTGGNAFRVEGSSGSHRMGKGIFVDPDDGIAALDRHRRRCIARGLDDDGVGCESFGGRAAIG